MKTISFIIPVYNEEKRFYKTQEALMKLRMPKGLSLEEIIFVDDGSTDKTVKAIRYFIHIMKKYNIQKGTKYRVIKYKQNQGKGYAIRRGMLAARSDYALFFDADMSTPLKELEHFMPVFDENIDVIVGTRKHKNSKIIRRQSAIRAKLGQGFTLLTGTILNMNLTDYTCGFKAFSKHARLNIFANCEINRWAFDAEILYLAHKYGFTVTEVPVVWKNDEYTKVELHRDVYLTLVDLTRIILLHRVTPVFAFARRQIVLLASPKF
jgi:dolichyl-phosphate beta-glucosyltransferase